MRGVDASEVCLDLNLDLIDRVLSTNVCATYSYARVYIF